VEVADDVVRVMQGKVDEVESQRQTREAADAEHRQEGGGEQHLGVEADRATPEEIMSEVRRITEGTEISTVVIWK
jgi:hypothetical protein